MFAYVGISNIFTKLEVVFSVQAGGGGVKEGEMRGERRKKGGKFKTRYLIFESENIY